MLYGSCNRSLTVSIIVAVTLVFVESRVIDTQVLMIWAAFFITSYGFRQLLSLAYFKQADRDQNAQHWLRWFRLATAGCGTAWGIASFLFYQASNDTTHQAFIIITLIGVSGGAILTYSIDSITSRIFAGSLFVFAFPSILFPATVFSIALISMLSVYIIYISISGAAVAKSFQDNMLMRIMAHQQEEKIRELAERQKLHIEHTPMGVIEWDSDLTVISWNKSAEQIFCYPADEAKHLPIQAITPLDQQAEIQKTLLNLFVDGETKCFQTENICKDGETIYCEWTFTPLKDPDGKVTGLASLVQDKTLFKKNQDNIHYLAYYDLLTGLPNRRLLMDRIEQAQISSKRSQSYCSLLFLDLDKFKDLNDLYGHQIGDQLLQEVSQRLKRLVREEDTISRFAGDEFVVMLENQGASVEQAMKSSMLVSRKITHSLNQVFKLGKYEHHTACSIGICLFVGKTLSPDEIVKRADIAMFQVKKSGRNGVQFFSEELLPQLEYRASLASDLRAAVFNVELIPYYQAQVNHRHEVIGAELLLRWNHPRHGQISPGEFIPIAEESSLINAIGHDLIKHACHQIKSWQSDANTCNIRLSINISARHFAEASFVEEVKNALDEAQCPPHLLRLELTESLLQTNIEDLASKMQRLKNDVGVSLSLDDFGTGYSSLSVLRNFPLDELKIDRSFIVNVLTNSNDADITEMIVSIGKKLGLEVIAEGVETEEQEAFLYRSGCLYYQGYLHARPLPLDQFQQHIAYLKKAPKNLQSD